MAAFLDLDGSPLAALFEQRLLASGRATWLERNALETILREQELAGIMDHGAVGRRVGLGRLLKAEILVLLRTASERVPAARNPGRRVGGSPRGCPRVGPLRPP